MFKTKQYLTIERVLWWSQLMDVTIFSLNDKHFHWNASIEWWCYDLRIIFRTALKGIRLHFEHHCIPVTRSNVDHNRTSMLQPRTNCEIMICTRKWRIEATGDLASKDQQKRATAKKQLCKVCWSTMTMRKTSRTRTQTITNKQINFNSDYSRIHCPH